MSKRRSPAQLARDRRLISRLYFAGKLQIEIAEEVGVSQSTVSLDLKVLQRQWLESSLIDFDKAKARELAKIDNLELTYHAAWLRSCEDAETLTQKGKLRTGEEKLQPAEATKTTKGQAGDPRFLQGIQWCIEKRIKIFGFDAPVKADVTGQLVIEVVGRDPDAD